MALFLLGGLEIPLSTLCRWLGDLKDPTFSFISSSSLPVTSSELQRVPYPPVDATKLTQTLSGTITMGQTLDPKALANAAAATEALGAPPVGVKFK